MARIKYPILRNKGSMLIVVLVVLSLFLVMAFVIINAGVLQYKLNIHKVSRSQALYIAEAGVNYYRWVLYHDPDEFCNREACKSAPDYGPYGPFPFSDATGNVTGHYELYIIPPAINGTNIVTVRSVGWTDAAPNIKRTIEVKCGNPSWSSYAVLSNDNMEFSAGAEVWGKIHSNKGIRFDGIANNLVTSALLSYDDPTHPDNIREYGVHTHNPLDPVPNGSNPPDNVPDNNSVFKAGRTFPVIPISFDLLDDHVNDLYSLATSSGMVLPRSNRYGYHITLKPDDTIDIRRVDAVSDRCRYRISGVWYNSETESILAESDLAIGTATPPNGLIFAKDKVWVDGQINGNRITILAFSEPFSGSETDIIVNNSLRYTNYNGNDAIGLIAQRNILVGMYSDDNLRIDAALIAKEGKIARSYFPNLDSNGCSKTYFKRNNITIYGSQAMKLSSIFAYADGSGYLARNYVYDANLTYGPPPHFPTTGEYIFISWKEK